MEGKVLKLENHNVNPVVGEDALDFNFDGNNENSPGSLGVPFMHSLAHPLRPKDVLIIEGTILQYGLRFTINLIFGFNEIAFHFNPRLDQNYIARSAYLKGVWAPEEGFGLLKCPLQSGKSFQVMIFISPEAYLVCVNGFHMFAFAHRVPPQTVEKIEIFGDIDLTTATLLTGEMYPDFSLIKHKRKVDSLFVPFSHVLKEPMKPGFKIQMNIKIKLLPISFIINLQSGPQVYPHPLIPYHFNVRYAPECYVVQNSWGFSGNKWDEEIRSPLPISLSPGKECEINIFLHDSQILVKGSDWSLPVFKLRLPLNNISAIHVQGDITLSLFKISSLNEQDEWTDASEDLLEN